MSLKKSIGETVVASCPSRIDVGNSLDFPSFFYSLPNLAAQTLNIAIELRTTVTWLPSVPGQITVSDGATTEVYRGGLSPSRTRFPIIRALLNHFGITTGTFHIDTQVPRGSGLGGSGMLVIAMLALMQHKGFGGLSRRRWPSMLLVAHLFENWLGFSGTGFHDQLAALYGGANLWTWGTHFDQPIPIYNRTPIHPPGGAAELDEHLLLCFTGFGHRPGKAARFLQPLPAKDLPLWTAVSEHTGEFAAAVKGGDWNEAARHLNAECQLRKKLHPACLSARAMALIQAARARGIGSRYVGYGHGGCVWACGQPDRLKATQTQWLTLCDDWNSAWVIKPRVARKGLVVH